MPPQWTNIHADQMPQFPGCENTLADAGKLSDCSYREMTTYVVKNVKYPATAREKGISGMPVIQFVVDQSGRVRDVEKNPSGVVYLGFSIIQHDAG